MTPRRRKASDEEIFAAAGRVMMRVSPSQLRLADVADEAGLTSGALVQRFGSKHGLLAALTALAAEGTAEMFARLRAAHASPLAALRAYSTHLAWMGDSPPGLSHHLAYLQLDLSDPVLHGNVRAQAQASREGIRALLDDAVRAGEVIAGVDTERLARTVEVTLGGSLLTWGFYQEGKAAAWIRADLEAVLGPYLGVR
jgi:AcrR family transcriptional regulator